MRISLSISPNSAVNMSEGRTLRLRSGQPWSGEDTQGCCVSLTGFQLAKTRHYGPHEGFTWGNLSPDGMWRHQRSRRLK